MEGVSKDVPDDLIRIYAVIGSITSAWSHTESAVNTTLWRLACVDHRQGFCLTAQIPSMRNRLHALIALLNLNGFSSGLITRVNKFSDRADKLARERNRVVHDPISSFEEKPEVITITAERKLRYEFREAKFAEYSEIERNIMELLGDYLGIDQAITTESEERASRSAK